MSLPVSFGLLKLVVGGGAIATAAVIVSMWGTYVGQLEDVAATDGQQVRPAAPMPDEREGIERIPIVGMILRLGTGYVGTIDEISRTEGESMERNARERAESARVGLELLDGPADAPQGDGLVQPAAPGQDPSSAGAAPPSAGARP